MREEFPITKRYLHFNSAAVAPCPRSVVRAMENYLRDKKRALMGLDQDMGPWNERIAESKKLFAKLIGARESEIVYVANATAGINTVLSMLPGGRGNNLVTSDIEYPMGAAVCLKQGEREVETRFAGNVGGEVRLEDVEKLVDKHTLAIVVDQAGWYNGFLHDLRALSEIAHEEGAYLVVDAIQSTGGVKIDVKKEGVDFLSSGSYKWLLAGSPAYSVGFLYIREDLVNRFKPAYVGLNTIGSDVVDKNVYDEFDLYVLRYREGTNRYEIYPNNEIGYVAVWASMRLLLDYGIVRVERRIKKLGNLLVEGLLDAGFELQTPVEEEKRLYINVKIRNNREIEKKLAEKRVIVSARVGGLRISPHFFNTKQEVDAFLEALKETTS